MGGCGGGGVVRWGLFVVGVIRSLTEPLPHQQVSSTTISTFTAFLVD